MLKDINPFIRENHRTNFYVACVDVHGNMKIRSKDTRNGWEVVSFANEKDFNNLLATSF